MKTKLILILTVLLAGCNLAIAQSPYATRLPAELQTAQMDSLADVTWLQGTTPAIRVEPLLRGRPVAVDADTTVRMVIGPSATGTLYAARTNLAAVTNAYEIQWPTIGTNSAGEAWFYTLLFDRAGYTYWSGSGKLYIEETTSTASNGLAWIEYTTPNVGWGNIVGDPGDNAALAQYVADHGGGSAEDTVARAGVSSNAADIAIMQTGKLDVATAATTYQPVGDYATGTPLYVETYLGTITGATITGGTVTTNSGVLEFTVEGGTGWTNLSITGTGNAITGATAAGTTLTLERGTIEGGGSGISAAEAGQIATNVAADYLPLSGYDGLVVLGTRTRGYAASTNLGDFGFAAGENTSAGDYGFAAGVDTSAGYAGFAAGAYTSAGDAGFAAGSETSAGSYGFAAGTGTSAGHAGFAAGSGSSAGNYGFAAGRAAKGADGSFVFADKSTSGTPFNRTNRPNEFAARAAGGVYFDTPMMVVTGTVSAGSITLGGETRTNWPKGTILGATINEPHTVATNDGILAFTVTADGSGFPLTNDVSAAGFAIEGMDKVVANSLYASNAASVRDLTVRRDITVLGDAECAGDLVVSGNLTLIGSATNLNWVVIDNRTNVYSGTNYIEKTVYSTQVLYSVTYAYTNIVTTNNINTYVNNNGTWNATNSEYVWLPHLSDYRDDKAYPVGTWNFSSSTVERITIPPDGLALASVAALEAGVATIDLGSNWCWRLVADTDCTAINFSTASVPEGDLVPNTIKAILLEVSRGESAVWAWGGHLSHITNAAPAAGAVSHLLLIAPSQDVTATNGWTVF